MWWVLVLIEPSWSPLSLTSSAPGVTCSTVGIRRRPNAFNIVWQLELLIRSGMSEQNAIISLEALLKEKMTIKPEGINLSHSIVIVIRFYC